MKENAECSQSLWDHQIIRRGEGWLQGAESKGTETIMVKTSKTQAGLKDQHRLTYSVAKGVED